MFEKVVKSNGDVFFSVKASFAGMLRIFLFFKGCHLQKTEIEMRGMVEFGVWIAAWLKQFDGEVN